MVIVKKDTGFLPVTILENIDASTKADTKHENSPCSNMNRIRSIFIEVTENHAEDDEALKRQSSNGAGTRWPCARSAELPASGTNHR